MIPIHEQTVKVNIEKNKVQAIVDTLERRFWLNIHKDEGDNKVDEIAKR